MSEVIRINKKDVFQANYKDARTLGDASQAIEILSPSERDELRTALRCVEAYFGKDAVSARLNVYSILLDPQYVKGA